MNGFHTSFRSILQNQEMLSVNAIQRRRFLEILNAYYTTLKVYYFQLFRYRRTGISKL